MTVAIAGASGFVGRALISELLADTYDVVAISRRRVDIRGVDSRQADVADEAVVAEALKGVDAAFYLVHSLAAGDFRAQDRQLAENFGRAAASAGVERIIYLGGLGEDPQSEHLASRQEVGAALGAAGVPVVELRAAVVLGAGSISFEILRYLTERLPFMICPRWVHTPIQPIALADVIRYLVAALTVDPGIYEIGGADVTTYREMIDAYAKARGLRRRRILDVPYLTPRLSSYWLDLVTPVDRRVSHALVESLVTEVVVRDDESAKAFDIEPIALHDALAAALDDQAARLEAEALDREDGLLDGVYTMRVSVPVPPASADRTERDFDAIGGSYSWYGLAALWLVRAMLGRLVGERLRTRRPEMIEPGAAVDWWIVSRREPGVLVLSSDGWSPGEGWLAYRCDDEELVQVGTFRPKGVPGFVYWKVLHPVHRLVFVAMARHRVRQAQPELQAPISS